MRGERLRVLQLSSDQESRIRGSSWKEFSWLQVCLQVQLGALRQSGRAPGHAVWHRAASMDCGGKGTVTSDVT